MQLNTLRIETSDDTPQMRRAVQLLTRQIEERCYARLGAPADDAVAVRLVVGDDSGDGFTISDGDRGLVIEGNGTAGLLHGIGKFLRTSTYTEDRFTPSSWRGSEQPECDLRGLYLAAHFHNFYQDAPVGEVINYIEEMALWGYNTIAVWFDRHEFNGLKDPAAERMLSRLSTIMASVKDLGLRVALMTLANEGYADSPRDLRADYTAGHDGYHTEPGGHYRVELCPSKPEALKLIIEGFEELAERVAPLGLDYLTIWPYDQGGCTCRDCAPWGANGFLRTADEIANSFRRRSPDTKIILSSWYFDHFTDGEWEGIAEAFRDGPPEWAAYLLAGDYGGLSFPAYPTTHGVPGDLPMISFPEISMHGMRPWGGFGANVRPREIQEMWASTRGLAAGGEVYSEGIFEDLNKVVIGQLFWRTRPVEEIVDEYVAYEFGVAPDARWRRLVELLESTKVEVRGELAGPNGANVDGPTPSQPVPTEGPDDADQVFDLARSIDADLCDLVKSRWRWRILYLRALIQTRLLNPATEAAELSSAYAELTEIYHAAGADPIVRPPLG